MNKASRKSGGKALKQAPEELENLLDLLNEFKDFILDSRMSELIEAGYEKHLLPLGIEIKGFYECYELERIGKFLKAFPDDNHVDAKMEWFTGVIYSMPERLALDIINQCPAYKSEDAKTLLALTKDTNSSFFESVYIKDENGQDYIQNFHFCMNRFEELYITYNILYDALHVWSISEPSAKAFFKRFRNNDSHFSLLDIDQSYRPFVRVDLDSKFKLIIRFSESVELLNKVEIERIRLCPRCDKFFWAGRKDVTGCSDCSAILRRKRWRDNHTRGNS